MNFRKLASIAGLGLGLTLAAGAAQSALYSFEDDDIDFILRSVGGVLTPQTSGALAVGDIFASILEIPVFTIDGVNGIPAGQEMTGGSSVNFY